MPRDLTGWRNCEIRAQHLPSSDSPTNASVQAKQENRDRDDVVQAGRAPVCPRITPLACWQMTARGWRGHFLGRARDRVVRHDFRLGL